jgi:hypothetical protein
LGAEIIEKSYMVKLRRERGADDRGRYRMARIEL